MAAIGENERRWGITRHVMRGPGAWSETRTVRPRCRHPPETRRSPGGDPVAPTLGRNRLHLDLVPSAPSTLVAEVERLVALGASRVDVGCADGIGMADPGGNEFCVVG